MTDSRSPTVTLPDAAVARLEEVVGPHVVTDPEVVASYTTDWTGRFVGHSPAVVRPGSTEEVAGVVAVCRELGLALVPQGGNTGLVGGGVPLHGEVVLSLRPARQSGAGRRPGRPGHGRGRGGPGRPPARGRGRRLGLRGGPGQPGVGHRGRHGGHQRRRPARPPLRRHPGPADRARGGAGDRRGGLPPGRTGQGQHRLRLARPGVRQRGDPGRGHRGPAAPGAPAAVPDGGPAGLPLRPRRPRRRAAASAAHSRPSRPASCSWPRAWSWSCSVHRHRPPVRRPPPGLPAGRGGRPGRPHRSPGRAPSARSTGWPTWPWPPSRPGGPTCGATARPTPRPSTPWGRRTSSTSPCRTGHWPSSSTGSPARSPRWRRGPGPGCSGTSGTATSTST